MKKIFSLTLLLSGFLISNAQTTAPAPTPNADLLQINEMEFDFGKLPQGKPVYHLFSITNTGTTELKLDNVVASCGCTTPEWKHEPIPAGGTTEIKVGYNAATEGAFDKVITITYNNTGSNKMIHIKGTVWKAPDGAAPPNASINFLKKQTF